MRDIAISTEFIKLESALKLCNAVESGGIGKAVIQDGLVSVNGEVCIMRGKKLRNGDIFSYENAEYRIVSNES